MNSNAIVTLADSKYFELLEELIDSIQSHEESKNVSICVLDAGLTKDQVSKLKKKVFSVFEICTKRIVTEKTFSKIIVQKCGSISNSPSIFCYNLCCKQISTKKI